MGRVKIDVRYDDDVPQSLYGVLRRSEVLYGEDSATRLKMWKMGSLYVKQRTASMLEVHVRLGLLQGEYPLSVIAALADGLDTADVTIAVGSRTMPHQMVALLVSGSRHTEAANVKRELVEAWGRTEAGRAALGEALSYVRGDDLFRGDEALSIAVVRNVEAEALVNVDLHQSAAVAVVLWETLAQFDADVAAAWYLANVLADMPIAENAMDLLGGLTHLGELHQGLGSFLRSVRWSTQEGDAERLEERCLERWLSMSAEAALLNERELGNITPRMWGLPGDWLLQNPNLSSAGAAGALAYASVDVIATWLQKQDAVSVESFGAVLGALADDGSAGACAKALKDAWVKFSPAERVAVLELCGRTADVLAVLVDVLDEAEFLEVVMEYDAGIVLGAVPSSVWFDEVLRGLRGVHDLGVLGAIVEANPRTSLRSAIAAMREVIKMTPASPEAGIDETNLPESKYPPF